MIAVVTHTTVTPGNEGDAVAIHHLRGGKTEVKAIINSATDQAVCKNVARALCVLPSICRAGPVGGTEGINCSTITCRHERYVAALGVGVEVHVTAVKSADPGTQRIAVRPQQLHAGESRIHIRSARGSLQVRSIHVEARGG